MQGDTASKMRDLVASEPGLSCTEIAERLGVTRGRVSQVLGALKDADVLEQRRNGKSTGVHLTESTMRKQWLSKRWR